MRDPATLTSDELVALVDGARWFAAKDRALESAEVVGVPVREGLVALAIVEVRFAAGTHEHYLLALGEDDEPHDAFERPEVAARSPRSRESPAEGAASGVRRRTVEQLGRARRAPRLKLYRRLEAGPNPELEMLRALGAARFPNVPEARGRARDAGAAARDRARLGHRPRALRGGGGSSRSTRSATTRPGFPIAPGASAR